MRTAPRAAALLAGLAAGLVVAAVTVLAGAPGTPAGAATAKTVQVNVVPQLAGVQFTLDGVPATTGPGGLAIVPDPDLSGAAAHLVLAPQQLSSTLRVSLDRVATDPNHGPFSRRLVVELDADRAVSFHFYGPKGTTLPLSDVQSVTLNDSLGAQVRLTPAQLRGPVWLPSSRPASVRSGVENRVVTYSVQSVMDHGTNVVNTGQLKFTANRSLTWSVPVILRSLTVVGNDLLTGGPAGSSVQLTYPDGVQRTLSLGPHHRITVADLPRGTYGVKVLGGALPLSSTVRLSRNQTADEVVITYGDVLEIFAIAVVVIGAVVVAGVLGRRRRHELHHHRGGTADVAVA